MNRKIDFLIIGAQKSGTTTLYDWLGQHPDIFLPETKEVLYFAYDDFYRQGEKYLDVFYKKYSAQKVAGGAYVHLMYFPHVVQRIFNYNPHMKIIAVIRNPIDRAYSAYWFARSNGWESCNTFEDALDREKERIHGSYTERAELTYLGHGKYAEQLQYFFDAFGSEKMMVVFTEDLRFHPGEVFDQVLKFLGLSSIGNSFDLSQDSNRSNAARLPALQKFLLSKEAWYKNLGRRWLPASLRMWIRTRFTEKIISLNRRPFEYPPMKPDTRKMLVDYYKPQNEKLEKLIGAYPVSWDQ